MAVTATISGRHVAERLDAALPGVVSAATEADVTVSAEHIVAATLFLRDDPELDCKYLNSLAAVDWVEHFEIVYHLSSLAKNHALVLRVRASHEDPVVPSVTRIWSGANLQEREAFDLMGIVFSDHPALKRVFLWEGFPGHPAAQGLSHSAGRSEAGPAALPVRVPGRPARLRGAREHGGAQRARRAASGRTAASRGRRRSARR